MYQKKLVVTGKLVVSFLSTNGKEADYEVYDRDTNERHRIGYANGQFRAVGREPTALEIGAVQAYLDEVQAEYVIWKKEFDRKYA